AMDFRPSVSCLQGRTVLLPGGRDKEGRPILLLTVPADSPPLDVVPSLQYLLSILSKTSRSRGITVIIDARRGPWKVARSCIRQVNAAFAPEELAQLIVVRPDAFWDKQRVENCTSSQTDNQILFIPRTRLTKYVDMIQLPTELGGNFLYNHDKWIETRQSLSDPVAEKMQRSLRTLTNKCVKLEKCAAETIPMLKKAFSVKCLSEGTFSGGTKPSQKVGKCLRPEPRWTAINRVDNVKRVRYLMRPTSRNPFNSETLEQKPLQTELKVEEFYADCEVTMRELEDLYQYVMRSKTLRPSQVEDAMNTSSDMAESTRMLVHNATETGKELVQNIEYENRTRKLASEDFELMSTPQDTLDTIERIDEIIGTIKSKQQAIESAWIAMERTFIDTKDLSQLEEGVVKVINWILGPAENLLNSKQKVGYDVSSAEELRREHEAIEFQCWETYGSYAELIHKINSFSDNENLSMQHKDLISQKDFMDFVCKSFALRTGEVFDSLVMGSNVADFDSAGRQLKELQESQANLDAVEHELVKEGEKLSDMLSMPIKDSLGREIIVDYTEDIINIRDILDATTARKNIFCDSVELQKLTLEQVTHIDSYEKDATQAIQWLDDLLQVMLKDHGHVGCTVNEIQRQKEEHQAFQETAKLQSSKGTYNYGCQLLNASLVLRQSCKLPLDDHANLYQKLRISWQRLLSVSQEQMTRLRVSAVFHRSVEEQCNQLRDLREAVATIPLMDLAKKRERVNYYYSLRGKVDSRSGEDGSTGKTAQEQAEGSPLLWRKSCEREELCRLLSSFASTESEDLEELCDSIANNEIAVEAISERLTEVTGLAEELDQALHSAQQDCLVLTTTSTSTSSLVDPASAAASTKKAMENSPTNPEVSLMENVLFFVTSL
ncbi:hypothetical protein NQ318_016810, partial [Aromia moschata]